MPASRWTTVEEACAWLHAAGATGLTADSRTVAAGDALLAWPGARHDARRHLQAALQAGAGAVLIEGRECEVFQDGIESLPLEQQARVASFDGLRAAAGPLAHAFYGQPSEHLDVVAVTGTNGKTSVSWGLAQALSASGRRCAVMGTLGIGEPGGALRSTGLTTPDAVSLHRAMASLRREGFAACSIEASSIGLVEGRLDGCRIRIACFTNLTQDHLDYHGTMEAYWLAKRRLFDWPGLAAAVVHVGDAHGAALAQDLADRRADLDLWTVAAGAGAADARTGPGPARLRILPDRLEADGQQRLMLEEQGEHAHFLTPLVGAFNRENLAVIAGALRASGLPLAATAEALGAIQPVPGRLQRVGYGIGQPQAVVDYAHTPDALTQALAALRPLADARGGRLWCVVGCGGNRDSSKRPLMAAAAQAASDRLVLTSDNPRHENPADILRQMVAGLAQPADVQVIEDRREAIAHAMKSASAADVVLLAGKGHETEQEIAGVRHPFSDAAEAAMALARRGGGRP